MSSTTAATNPSATAERDRARHALVPVAVASFVLAAFFNLVRADSGREALIMVGVDLVAVCALYPLVLARGLRQESVGGRALAMGVLAVLLILPAFWSGLPMVLGAGAALLGYAGRRATTGSAQATAGFVLGALAVIGYVAFYVSDWIANPGASWWS